MGEAGLEAEIIGTKIVESTVFYVLKVTQNQQTWKVERRYNDFLQLDRRIGRTSVELPEKGRFGFRKIFNLGSFRERRLERLNAYLQPLARNLSGTESSSSLLYM